MYGIKSKFGVYQMAFPGIGDFIFPACFGAVVDCKIRYLTPKPLSWRERACQDFSGNKYLSDNYNGIYEIGAIDQVLVSMLSGDDVGIISSMTMDATQKNIYISAKHQIHEISDGTAVTPGGQVTKFAGDKNAGFVNGPEDKAEFNGPSGIAFTISWNNNIIYVSDNGNNLIRRIIFLKIKVRFNGMRFLCATCRLGTCV